MSDRALPAGALPHTGRARMIVRTAEDADGRAVRIGRISADHPCAANGAVPSAVVIELGAQAAASLAPEGAAPGRVVALRNAAWDVPTVPVDTDLEITVELTEDAGNLRNYTFEVAGCGRGVVSVWIEAP